MELLQIFVERTLVRLSVKRIADSFVNELKLALHIKNAKP